MKKEDFLKLGLDEETAKKCETASVEELKGYVPYDRFKEVNDEKAKFKNDLKERDEQLETLKNSTADVETFKKQIETLQGENKAKDEAHALEMKQLKIDSAVSSVITKAKGKNAKAIKALLNLENAELLEDGTVKGLKEQIDTLVKAEDSKFLFESEEVQFKGAVPAGSVKNKSTGITKETFSKMGYKERVELFNTNRDLYDQLVNQ